MTNPLIQIGDEVREMTDDEYTAWLADGEKAAARETEAAAKAATRAAALAKLGLTAEEIDALFG